LQRNPLFQIHIRAKQKPTKEKANTIFNEARQFVYVLRVGEREILLIQQSITSFFENFRGILTRIPRGYNS